MSAPSQLVTALPGTRFEARKLLGWGGMGVVYEAYDRAHRTKVAIKTLRSLDAAGLIRFKNEFRSLVDLAHPNLVRLGELLEESGQLFFTMELVEGQPFVDYVRGISARTSDVPLDQADRDTEIRPRPPSTQECLPAAMTGQLDENKLRPALAGLARGLLALHATGRIHRDIKPSNVLVTPEGRVVILDFGLVTEAHDTLGEEEQHVVGTAHFMAPEQAAGKALSTSADWYSVGVMLHLSLTGVLPFEVSADAVATHKQRAVPLAPSAVVPNVPADLDALTVALLSIDPAERADGNDILRILGEQRGSLASSTNFGAAFVGRNNELREIESAYWASLDGRARALFIEGESGMGKTTLGRRFLDKIADEALVFSARCYERESVPYKACDGLVDRLGTHLAKLPPASSSAILPKDIELLAAVFPVLAVSDPVAKRRTPLPASGAGSHLGDEDLVLDLLDEDTRPRVSPGFLSTSPIAIPPEIEPAELRARVFTAMRRLLHNLAEQKPLVIAIDDLQWADADSLAMLSEILRPDDADEIEADGKPAPLFLLASVQSDEAHSTPIDLALPASLVRRMKLSQLPTDEARALVDRLLRALAGDTPLDRIDVNALLAEGGGHPLFLDALVRYRLQNTADTSPLRLDDALWARVENLSSRARRALIALSVAGKPLSRRVLEHALSADGEEMERLLAELRAGQFSRAWGSPENETLEPYHERLRETVLSHLQAEEKRALHGHLAIALETVGDAELEDLSVHWLGAGDMARAAQYAAKAGDQAAQAFAFDSAARLYALAVSLLPAPATERASLFVRLGDAHSNGGRGREAALAYESAAALYPENTAVELYRRAAENLLRSGYIDEGMEHLRTVLAAVDIDFPLTPATTLAALLFRRAELRLRGLSFEEKTLTRISPADLRRVDVCWSASLGLGMVDALRGAYFQVRCLLFALSAGDAYRVSRALSMETAFVATAGPSARPRVNELLDAAERAATRSAHPHALALVPGVSGVALFLEGRFSEAIALLQTSENALRTKCVGVHWEAASILTFALWCQFFTGDFRALAADAPGAIREAEERGDRYLATNLCSGFTNIIWLIADEPQTAIAMAERSYGPWSRAGTHLQHFHDLVARCHSALYAGDGASAFAAIETGWKALDDSMSFRIQLVRIFCEYLRGATALSTSMTAAAPTPYFQAAVRASKRIEGERVSWALPLALTLRAGAKWREGQSQSAVLGLLEDAHRMAKSAGLMGYATAIFRAIGVVRGDEAGRAATAEADSEFIRRGVINPPRFARTLVPGFEPQSLLPRDAQSVPPPQN
ncbi:MAG: AAA family ATPase [Polyangiaceae bacterium]|nr:AAA family ATPase [Polyangiaceae bacterium]